MKPKRVQRSRSKGWRMPAGAIYVGRQTKWGNPFKVGDKLGSIPDDVLRKTGYRTWSAEIIMNDTIVTDLFRVWIIERIQNGKDDLSELRGKTLVCWCNPEYQICHADVLLELANKSGITDEA